MLSFCPGTSWASTRLPVGKVVAVTDTLGASGSFVLHDFVALFLKAGAVSGGRGGWLVVGGGGGNKVRCSPANAWFGFSNLGRVHFVQVGAWWSCLPALPGTV